jgi:hypothetical protein
MLVAAAARDGQAVTNTSSSTAPSIGGSAAPVVPAVVPANMQAVAAAMPVAALPAAVEQAAVPVAVAAQQQLAAAAAPEPVAVQARPPSHAGDADAALLLLALFQPNIVAPSQ